MEFGCHDHYIFTPHEQMMYVVLLQLLIIRICIYCVLNQF